MSRGGSKIIRVDIMDVFDPSVEGRAAQKGALFRQVEGPGSPKLFIKLDDGFTTNWAPFDLNGPVLNDWLTSGNNGAGNVLGTLTADQWIFIAGGVERGGFFGSGEFYLKTHPNYPGSEWVHRTESLTTLDDTPSTIDAVNVPANRNGTICICVQGRNADTLKRANFKRDIAVHNLGGGAVVDLFQTSFTSKTDQGFNVTAVSSGDDILIQVKGDPADTMYWTINTNYQLVGVE